MLYTNHTNTTTTQNVDLMDYIGQVMVGMWYRARCRLNITPMQIPATITALMQDTRSTTVPPCHSTRLSFALKSRH